MEKELQVTNKKSYKLQIAGYRFKKKSYGLQITCYGFMKKELQGTNISALQTLPASTMFLSAIGAACL
jgi:hypothetical protein